MTKKNIAIFASGSGSNAKKIIEHFKNIPTIEVVLVVSNKPKAGVLNIAKSYDIECCTINRDFFYNSLGICQKLNEYQVDLIALAGFLWLIPPYLITAYPQKIINIHPSLLPKYGGKGMYGMHVHRAVKEAKEKQSGMTIHFVNEKYDDGNILFQKARSINSEDSSESIAKKVLELEHYYYPRVLERLLKNQPIEFAPKDFND